MKIVISGSTGQIGSKLTEMLDYSKNEIVLLGRDRSKLKDPAARGAIVKEGNLLDGEFLHEALSDADIYFFLPPPNFRSDDMVEEYRRLATVSRDAAREAAVERIIHLSTLGAHLDREETGLIRGQHLAEQIIRDGAPHVLHLRNGFFLENYLGAVQSIAEQGAIYFPVSPETRYAFVATQDVAKIIYDLLDSPGWSGHRVIEFQGPNSYSFAEIASQFAKSLDREINHVAVPPEAAEEAMVGLGMSQAYARDLVRPFTSIESGILVPEFERSDSRVRRNGLTPAAFARVALLPDLENASLSEIVDLIQLKLGYQGILILFLIRFEDIYQHLNRFRGAIYYFRKA